MKAFWTLPCVLLALAGCSREEFRLEKGRAYDLQQWPDSAYLAMVDSEYAKDTTRERKGVTFMDAPESKPTEMILSDLPPEVATLIQKGKERSKEAASGHHEAETQESSSSPENTVSAEKFAELWIARAQQLREDPNNRQLFREVRAEDGDSDWSVLLLRVYGPQIRSVPRLIQNQVIQDLNPGASAPENGRVFKLPKL